MYRDETHHGMVHLDLEDDSTITLRPLVVIEISGLEYLALTPPGDESEDVYFYRFIEHSKNEIELLNIEDDEVLDSVMSEFEKWFDAQLQQQEREE